MAVTKFQKSCKHTVSVQLRAFDVNVGFENFLQHFCLSHLGQSKCERKQQLSTSFLPSALLQWSIKSYVNVANAVFPEKQRDGVILAWPFYQGEMGFNCSPSHCSLHFPPIERVMFFWPYKLDILESFPPRLVVGAHILTTFNLNWAT